MKAATRLGLELRRARMARGLSQRELARMIGLTAHSNIGDYERGLRIAPRDIMAACDQVLATGGELCQWRDRALAERADDWLDTQLAED